MQSPSNWRSPRRSEDSVSESPLALKPQSQYPFPQQDASRRPSFSSNTYRPRRGSTASTTSSIAGSIDGNFARAPGTVMEGGENAISTLLQPPIVRTGLLPHTSAPASSTHKAPTQRDIPPVTLTNIPHVDPSTFKSYLSQVGTLYDAFQRSKQEPEAATPPARRRESARSTIDEGEQQLERGLRRESASGAATPRLGSIVGLPSTETLQPKRRASGGIGRRHQITPLTTIPNIYFDEHFQLENPRTFDVVSERSEVVRQPFNPNVANDESKQANGSANGAPRKALATNAILQEKLSWYMDTVEMHLINSIATASTSFFAALGSLKQLQSEAADSVKRIHTLREDLGKLDKEMAQGGLKIIAMKRRRENLRRLGAATEQLRCVMDLVMHCEQIIEAGELDIALERIEALERLVAGTFDVDSARWLEWMPKGLPPTIVDLRGLKALDGLSEGLDQLRYRVGHGYQIKFLEILIEDIRRHVKNVPARETLQRWGAASRRGGHSREKSILPKYMITDEKLRRELLANLLGLSKCKYMTPATIAFRDALLKEVKTLIRFHLPSSNDDDAESMTSISTRGGRQLSRQDKSSILARNLRSLDPEAAEELYTKVYTGVSEALRRLSTQVKVLLDVTSGVGSPPNSGGVRSPPRSPNIGSIDSAMDKVPAGRRRANSQLQEELMQALDMSSLLGQAVDVAQTQITKVLKARSEQTIALPLHSFLRYFTLNRLFADECEAISGRSGAALKGVVNTHITDFVPAMAEAERTILTQVMENDRWEVKDFEPSDDAILSRTLAGMTRDPERWQQTTWIWESPAATNGVNGTGAENGTEKGKTAIIDEEKFILVDSSTVALRGLERFLKLITAIPSMTQDVSLSLIDYLKLFNSRSCQLILGAGATRKELAGLKNINTKHLALASQSLSFIIALIPYIREFVRRHQNPTVGPTVLPKFDEVKRLYQDHQASIHDKLVDIMAGRATSHCKAMAKVDYDSPDVLAQQTSPFMETLVKETVTLNRVLAKHLPEMQVRMIMGPVFQSYKEQWGKAFGDANVKTSAGKARLLRDAELFDSRLSKIEGAGDIGTYVKNIVEGKSVQTTPAPSAAAAQTSAPEEKGEGEPENKK